MIDAIRRHRMTRILRQAMIDQYVVLGNICLNILAYNVPIVNMAATSTFLFQVIDSRHKSGTGMSMIRVCRKTMAPAADSMRRLMSQHEPLCSPSQPVHTVEIGVQRKAMLNWKTIQYVIVRAMPV
jgi:hypothetical protein